MNRQTENIKTTPVYFTARPRECRGSVAGWPRAGQALALAAVAALTSGSVLAQQDFDEYLQGWNYDKVYQGWSAETLLDDTEVYGETGEELGDVENLLINEHGQIVALIAEVGGLWDIGDTHIAVPWDRVRIDNQRLTLPVTEGTIDAYSLFHTEYFSKAEVGTVREVDEDVATGSTIWKATQLMDDYAVLEDGEGYGYVNDLVFDNQGQLLSVLVNVTYGGNRGYYGYPWFGWGHGYAWDPLTDYYQLPYSAEEISTFDEMLDADQIDPMPQ